MEHLLQPPELMLLMFGRRGHRLNRADVDLLQALLNGGRLREESILRTELPG